MEYNREFARKIMAQPNNCVVRYLKHMIERSSVPYSMIYETLEKERVKLHCEILLTFGFNPQDDKQYERSKHVLGSIDKILQYYLPTYSTFDISNRLVANLYSALETGVILEKDLDDIQRFICMFLIEQNTRKFIEGTLEPYNNISIYDYVFISDMHSYYDRKRLERKVREEQISIIENFLKDLKGV